MSRLGKLIEEQAVQRTRSESDNGKCADCQSPPEPPRPRYEWHKPAFVRFFGTGCLSCGSTGWLQRQISTPRRIVRFMAWSVGLVPRVRSMMRTVFSRKVSTAEYMKRMKVCHDNSFGQGCGVRFLRFEGTKIVEDLHCGKCNCPRTRFASLRRKNRKAGWVCPAGLHDGSDGERVFREYVALQVKGETNGD